MPKQEWIWALKGENFAHTRKSVNRCRSWVDLDSLLIQFNSESRLYHSSRLLFAIHKQTTMLSGVKKEMKNENFWILIAEIFHEYLFHSFRSSEDSDDFWLYFKFQIFKWKISESSLYYPVLTPFKLLIIIFLFILSLRSFFLLFRSFTSLLIFSPFLFNFRSGMRERFILPPCVRCELWADSRLS